MLYIRSKSDGTIVQSAYVNNGLIHYAAGDIWQIIGTAENPETVTTAAAFGDLLKELKQNGYKLRAYNEPERIRNRNEERQGTAGSVAIGIITTKAETMTTEAYRHRGRRRNNRISETWEI